MGITLDMTDETAARLAGHLAAGPDEQLAFMLAMTTDRGFTVTAIRPMGAGTLDIQSPWHLALGDRDQAAVIKWAHTTGGVLVEAHVHLGGFPASFSPYDIKGLGEWVPHVWWRLAHRPYFAHVFSGDTFDGLCWMTSPSNPVQVEALVVGDREPWRATSRTLTRGWMDGSQGVA